MTIETRRVDTSICARGLTKVFGIQRAVDGITFELPRGGVTGFVGPNGSGKSTTIRMLLGLIKPTEGTAEVLGCSVSNPKEYLARVGALIESPAFYPSMSGADNLRVLAALGGHPRTRVDQVLETVGLADRAGDRVGDYSLGMKQRLGISAALLPNPELLILDEPTNGLDPAGIVEIRQLLKWLGAEGVAVFVSSHLLAEIQAGCDRLVIISSGRLVFAGELDELLEYAGMGLVARPELSGDVERLADLVASAGHNVQSTGDALLIDAPSDWAAELNRLAMGGGITLRELKPQIEELEDVFLRMTGDGAVDQ